MLYSNIKIGDKEYKMCCAASVNLAYYNIFHEDFMSQMNPDEPSKAITPFTKMAFVMAMKGEKSKDEMKKLTMADYENWMDEFSFGDLVAAMPQIQSLYLGSASTLVEAKKNTDEPSDK